MNFSASATEASKHHHGASGKSEYDPMQRESAIAPSEQSYEAHPQTTSTELQSKTSAEPQYDVCSYDNLQDHAYQLSVSAGYSTGIEQQLIPPVSASVTTNSQGQVESSQQMQNQQVFYYQQLPSGMQYASSPTTGIALQPRQPSQPTFATQLGLASLVPNQSPVQQYYQVSAGQHAHSYIQPQGQAQSAPHVAPYQSASSSMTEPIQVAGSKRSVRFPEESGNKRQSRALPAGQPAPRFSPQTVPSGSSAAFDFDDEIDPMLRPPPANYATMTAEEKRRYDRNVREQQRSYKISQQIKELRNVLSESNISFKPNKFSILMSVVDYVKQLQSRAIMLDAEHRKLLDTIRQTNEMVNTGIMPAPDVAESGDNGHGTNAGSGDMLFVQGLDYQAVFQQCPAALGVASLDGRILACNDEFVAISGISREILLRQSLFNLMTNHEDVFRAMGAMLSTSCATVQSAENSDPPAPLYWSGVVNQKSQSLYMNITLTRSEDGLPKFFNCALAPA